MSDRVGIFSSKFDEVIFFGLMILLLVIIGLEDRGHSFRRADRKGARQMGGLTDGKSERWEV